MRLEEKKILMPTYPKNYAVRKKYKRKKIIPTYLPYFQIQCNRKPTYYFGKPNECYILAIWQVALLIVMHVKLPIQVILNRQTAQKSESAQNVHQAFTGTVQKKHVQVNAMKF